MSRFAKTEKKVHSDSRLPRVHSVTCHMPSDVEALAGGSVSSFTEIGDEIFASWQQLTSKVNTTRAGSTVLRWVCIIAIRTAVTEIVSEGCTRS